MSLDRRANLSGKRAIVIGGADGIGRAVTLALAEAGVDIAFCDNLAAAIAPTAAAIEAMGRRVLGTEADVMSRGEIGGFYKAAVKFFDGSIDILVNIAGGAQIQPFMDREADKDADDIRRNFGYVLDSVRYAIPLLRASGRGGVIVNFTTVEAHRAAGGLAVYAGAKAATSTFSKAMAWELGPDNIRVNTVVPDSTPSRGNARAMAADPAIAAMNDGIPAEYWAAAHRMAKPLQVPTTEDDLANAVLFLASDLAAHITGIDLHVDAGTKAAGGMLRWPEDGGLTLPLPMGPTLRRLFG